MDTGGRFQHLGKNLVVATALLAAGFFAAWLRYSPHLGTAGAYTDGVREYDSFAGEPIRFAVWEQAARLAGELGGDEGEHRPTLSPDGRWLVFASGARGTNAELYVAEMRAGEAVDPRPLYELNSRFDELAPAFGHDALYFMTNRPGGAGGFDLWRAPVDGDGEFGAPEPLDESVNTRRDEVDPAPLPGGLALAFSSNRDDAGRRGHDFFLARPGTGGYEVTRLDALSSWQDDRELAFTSDGRRAFFSSDRAGSGDYDLFASLYEQGAWLAPSPIDGLNGPGDERGPAPSAEGFELVFEVRPERATPSDGLSAELFHARSLEIFQRPGARVGLLDLLILVALLVLALLAWLAKRWESIEVLYKCFLVSLLLHAALMYWFRDVHPKAEIAELPQSGPTYRVQLATASTAAASSAARERGGAVEVAATFEEPREAAEPSRRAATQEAALDASVPTAARVARAEGQATAAPAPRAEAREREATQLAAAPALRDATQVARAELGPARESALQTSAAGPSAAERSPSAAAAPSRRAAALATNAASAPEARPLARADRGAESEPPAQGKASLAPSPTGTLEVTSTGDLRAPSDFQAGAALATADEAPLAGLTPKVASPTVADPRGRLEPSASPSRRRSEARGDGDTLAEPERYEIAARARDGSETGASLERERESHERAATPGAALAATAPLRALEERDLGEAPTTVVARAEASFEPLAGAAPIRRAARATEAKPRRRRAGSELPSATHTPRPERYALSADQRPAREADTALASAERLEHTPYRSRFGPAKARALEEYGGTQETEAAVATGLAYLAGIQAPSGHWGQRERVDGKYGEVCVGKTGLCLLAFLGAGHTQDSGTTYSETVASAIDFLLGVQHRDSGHFGRTASYSHGIATYALAEAYALTRDERLLLPLERAVAQILSKQNRDTRDRRRFGGWSYYYRNDRTFDSWPRVSITSWQVMALESARLGGVEVPDRAFDDARTFLAHALDVERGCFRYAHDPERMNGLYSILPGSTPAALFALSLLGLDLEDDDLDDAWRFVTSKAPDGYRYTSDNDFVDRAQGNLYFWYYGSLACMRRGGATWRRWNAALQETLLESQRGDGSWRPISIYARQYAGDDGRDASYSTAMNVLSLEVYYRYFTPLLDVSKIPPAASEPE